MKRIIALQKLSFIEFQRTTLIILESTNTSPWRELEATVNLNKRDSNVFQ